MPVAKLAWYACGCADQDEALCQPVCFVAASTLSTPCDIIVDDDSGSDDQSDEQAFGGTTCASNDRDEGYNEASDDPFGWETERSPR